MTAARDSESYRQSGVSTYLDMFTYLANDNPNFHTQLAAAGLIHSFADNSRCGLPFQRLSLVELSSNVSVKGPQEWG